MIRKIKILSYLIYTRKHHSHN